MDKLFLIALFFFILFQVVKKYFRKTSVNSKNSELISDDFIDSDEISCYSGAYNVKSDKFNNSILESAGYFIASNDEKQVNSYYPTSLQDIDPNELA